MKCVWMVEFRNDCPMFFSSKKKAMGYVRKVNKDIVMEDWSEDVYFNNDSNCPSDIYCISKQVVI